MKLPDFFRFEPLNRLKSQMGIGHDIYGKFSVTIDPGRLTSEELERLVDEGIDVELKDVTILPDGTLAYKDSRVLLYIRDIHIYGHREWEPRYHLFNCKKLVDMFQHGRFNRYVVATRADGQFKINLIKEANIRSEDRRLRVCQFCLDGLPGIKFNFRAMSSGRRELFVSEFVPDDFFKIYPRSLHVIKPEHDSNTAPLYDYPPEFNQISERLRRNAGWRCHNCKVGLSQRKQYLHIHHVNGNRADSSPDNLKVLCIACHAEEPQHAHMRKTPAYAEFVKLTTIR